MMKILIGLLIALVGGAGAYVGYEATAIKNSHSGISSGVQGAPGPLAGAGLPVIAVGYGVYWLATRRRKGNSSKPDQTPRA
jgi:hypothetical protein